MFENKNNRTELSEIGEFGLIRILEGHVQLKQPGTLRGIGDDAAVIDSLGEKSVVTKDLLLEGVHFDLSYCPLKHLGYKAIAVNLSDICAMNATPRQVLVGIGISNRFSLEAVEELYAGMLLACENYGVDLIGGDTTSSHSGLTISVTAIGSAEEAKLVYRSGARLNDIICVSGDLGAAYMGLQLLNREKKVFEETPGVQPMLEGYDYLLERQLKPEPRYDIITKLNEWNIQPNAMIDISDGLASDIMHICRASNAGCQLYEEKIPVDHLTRDLAREFGLDPTICALNGGEDYELLFTIPLSEFDKVKDKSEITVIGHITDAAAGYHLVDRQNNLHKLTAQGWDAFRE